MQKHHRIFTAAIAALLLIITPFAHAEEKSEETLLKEAVALSKEVKEFEKTLGIEPTEALSKSTLTQPNSSLIWIWQQKLGTLALDRGFDVTTRLSFSVLAEEIPLKNIRAFPDYSVYFRTGNEFSGEKSVITVTFALEPSWRKVEVFFHEDLHGNIEKPEEDEESIVSALGFLAALEFFTSKKDVVDIEAAKIQINDARTISKELNAFVRDIEQEIGAVQHEIRWDVIKRLTKHMESSYPAYARLFKNQLKNQEALFAFEAKISHDFMYYKHIDCIVALYEKVGTFGVLFHEIKNAPEDTRKFSVYLDALEKKYESPTTK